MSLHRDLSRFYARATISSAAMVFLCIVVRQQLFAWLFLLMSMVTTVMMYRALVKFSKEKEDQ